MIVYHGSFKEIKEIDLSQASPYKDFGRGFYTTNIREQAEFWATQKGVENNCNGFVSDFKFDDDKAFFSGDYKTLRFNEYNSEWFDFVISNRTKKTTETLHDYDIVEGPVADDKISKRIMRYLKGNISKQDFLEDLKYSKKPTHQICFCTRKSLFTIERINLSALFDIEDIGEAVISHLMKNDNLSLAEAEDLYYDSDTYEKLSDESTGLHKKTGQEIYDMLKIELSKSH